MAEGAAPEVLFVVASSETHLPMYAPVVERLRERVPGLRLTAFSIAEFKGGRQTDRPALGAVFDRVDVLADERPSGWATRLAVLAHRLTWRRWQIPRRLDRATIERVIRRAVTRPSLRLVVVPNDRSFPQSWFIRWARAAGRPVLLVQESLRKDEAMTARDDSPPLGAGGCDRIAAWGESSREYFLRVGAPEERVRVTGNPRPDGMIKEAASLSRLDVRRCHGLPEEGRVVLFATNPIHWMGILSPEEYVERIRAVLRAAVSIAEVHVLVKCHELERAELTDLEIPEEIDRAPHASWARDITLIEAIVGADAVIVFNSTVALEAVLLERPVAMLALGDEELGTDFVREGVATELANEEDLLAFLGGASAFSVDPVEAAARQLSHIGASDVKIAAEIIDLAALHANTDRSG